MANRFYYWGRKRDRMNSQGSLVVLSIPLRHPYLVHQIVPFLLQHICSLVESVTRSWIRPSRIYVDILQVRVIKLVGLMLQSISTSLTTQQYDGYQSTQKSLFSGLAPWSCGDLYNIRQVHIVGKCKSILCRTSIMNAIINLGSVRLIQYQRKYIHFFHLALRRRTAE